MIIQRGMYGLILEQKDKEFEDHLAWVKRNYVIFFKNTSGIQAFMDKITFIRWQRFFNIKEEEIIMTENDVTTFEGYAQFNLSIDKNQDGSYKDDNTFQAWQFFKLGRNSQ